MEDYSVVKNEIMKLAGEQYSESGNSDTEWKVLWILALDLQNVSTNPGETAETRKVKKDQVLERGSRNERSQTGAMKWEMAQMGGEVDFNQEVA